MSKKLVIVTLFIVLCFSAFASESIRTFLPSQTIEPVYPIDESIGQTVENDKSPAHSILSKALSTPFDFNWCETFISPDSKKTITTLYSSILSEITGNKGFYLSRAYKNADNSFSISARFTDRNEVLTFVILDNYIIGITSVKK